MSEGMAELFRERFPNQRFKPLLHTFNEDIPGFKPPPPPSSPLKLALSGNINPSCLDATRRMADAIASLPDIELTYYTGTLEHVLRQYGVLREGMRRTTLSRTQLLDRLRAADILLLPHGFDGPYSREEYETIFPTRTIEYLISGRPILAHTPPNAYLTRFLKKHQCALVVDVRDSAAVRLAIQRLRADADLRAHLVRNALHTAKMFRASTVAAELRQVLAGSVEREPSPAPPGGPGTTSL